MVSTRGMRPTELSTMYKMASLFTGSKKLNKISNIYDKPWPATARIKLGITFEKGHTTASTIVGTLVLVVVIETRKCLQNNDQLTTIFLVYIFSALLSANFEFERVFQVLLPLLFRLKC